MRTLARSPFCDSKVDRYCRGMCHSLAWAINDITGWQAVGITDFREKGHDPDQVRIGHALIRLPGGLLLDGRGISAEADVLDHFKIDTTEFRQKLARLAKNGYPCISADMDLRIMVHPVSAKRLTWYMSRRLEGNIEYFGPDCHQTAITDAATLVRWARKELSI